MKKIALIPAFEPDNKLIELVEDLYKQNIVIVVVDDGKVTNTSNSKVYVYLAVGIILLVFTIGSYLLRKD